MKKKNQIEIYDTTLRDGSQAEGISFTLEDKLEIAKALDEFGVDVIEGGWPVSNPKDMAFFKEIKKRKLKHAQVSAFGSTRLARYTASEDPNLQSLIQARTPVVAIFGKSWDLHVRDALRIRPEENLRMVRDSVRYLKKKGKRVVFDAEHFFDGYKDNPTYARKVLEAAAEEGASVLALCDTNGGTLSHEVLRIISEIASEFDIPLGMHAHNDADVAVANTLAAVDAGATHVQGTINGYGERCGNVDLCSVMADLAIKMKKDFYAKKNVSRLAQLSMLCYEVSNQTPRTNQPFVGVSAFAHKGGIHVNAVQKNPKTYEHIDPRAVGNSRRILVSELAGRSLISEKIRNVPFLRKADDKIVRKILTRIQQLENEGYHFEVGEASFELMAREIAGKRKRYFEILSFRAEVEKRGDDLPLSEATVKVRVNGTVRHTCAEGDGPVDALNRAFRKALEEDYPMIKQVHLVDYKVRVIDAKAATAAKVRVVIRSEDRDKLWGTLGVSENLIEASIEALADSIEYKLLKDGVKPAR